MLVWVSVGLVALALVIVAKWLAFRRDSLGRPRRFPVISVAVLLVSAVAVSIPTVLRLREEATLTRAATALTGLRTLHVHCQTLGEAFVDAGGELGLVQFRPDGTPEPSTIIKRDQCGDLADYVGSDKTDPTLDQIVAVHVLTHESMHMAGIRGEAQAECAAMQRDAQTAMLLGASELAGTKLAARYWEDVYPRMPDDYRSWECAPGARMDERRPDAPWAPITS